MSRLCWAPGRQGVYAAFGASVYGFSWSLEDEQLRHNLTIEGFTDECRIVVEGPAGLLAVADGTSLCIADPGMHERRIVACVQDAHGGQQVFALACDASTGLLASSGRDKSIKVWRVHGHSATLLATTVEAHADWVLALQVCEASETVLSTGIDGVISAWRLAGGALTPIAQAADPGREGVLSLQLWPEGGLVASAGQD
ncbi:unnamed protein product, partial [Prorocentrum cordatum]